MNIYGTSVLDLAKDFHKAMNHYRERQLQLTLWKQQNGYKYMTKKRWEQWLQQNLK